MEFTMSLIILAQHGPEFDDTVIVITAYRNRHCSWTTISSASGAVYNLLGGRDFALDPACRWILRYREAQLLIAMEAMVPEENDDPSTMRLAHGWRCRMLDCDNYRAYLRSRLST